MLLFPMNHTTSLNAKYGTQVRAEQCILKLTYFPRASETLSECSGFTLHIKRFILRQWVKFTLHDKVKNYTDMSKIQYVKKMITSRTYTLKISLITTSTLPRRQELLQFIKKSVRMSIVNKSLNMPQFFFNTSRTAQSSKPHSISHGIPYYDKDTFKSPHVL